MSDDCFATLLFRDNLTTSRPRRQFAEDEAMVRLWLSRMLQLTSLRIFVMFARLDEASVRHMLRDPPAQRVTLMSVPVVRAAENGTLPHYRLMHTKLHAWSLPCARVALLDYDVIAIRDPSPIFDACGRRPSATRRAIGTSCSPRR